MRAGRKAHREHSLRVSVFFATQTIAKSLIQGRKMGSPESSSGLSTCTVGCYRGGENATACTKRQKVWYSVSEHPPVVCSTLESSGAGVAAAALLAAPCQ
jgi:hypothetical protein